MYFQDMYNYVYDYILVCLTMIWFVNSKHLMLNLNLSVWFFFFFFLSSTKQPPSPTPTTPRPSQHRSRSLPDQKLDLLVREQCVYRDYEHDRKGPDSGSTPRRLGRTFQHSKCSVSFSEYSRIRSEYSV